MFGQSLIDIMTVYNRLKTDALGCRHAHAYIYVCNAITLGVV